MQPTIDPRVLQAWAAGQDIGQFGYMTAQHQPGYWEGGDAGGWINSGPAQTHLIHTLDKNASEVFDQQGNFLGINSGDTDSQGLTKFVLAALAMYAGGQGLAGMSGGAGAAGGAGADLAASGGGEVLAGGAGTGIGGSAITLTPAEIAAQNAAVTSGLGGQVSSLMPYLGTGEAAAAGGGGLLDAVTKAASDPSNWAKTAATTGLNSMRQGEIADYSTNGSLPSSAAVDYGDQSGNWFTRALSDPKNWARLAGGIAGAADSGDQTKTQSETKEPWAPAQGWLKEMIGSGQGLFHQYQQQPLSLLQQQAYGNQFGLLNSANQQMPAWMASMNANSSGANNYDPKRPRTLIGTTAQAPQFGLLNPSFKLGG